MKKLLLLLLLFPFISFASLEVKSVDLMKYTQDTMSSPLSSATIATLVQRGVDLGATHLAIAIPFGLTNSVSEMKRWADAIHAKGLKVLWRSDDPSKHPMYNQPIFVGSSALPLSTYQSRIDFFIRNNPSLFADGDIFAPYYEPTSYWSGDGKVVNFWTQSQSWLNPNSQANFTTFFTGIYNTSKSAFSAIGKNVQVGMTSTNGSEYLNKWIQPSLVNLVGVVSTDHYVDNNPTQMEADLRKMSTDYGKPVFLQETAPNRNTTPTSQQITDYFNALKRLVTDGVLTRYNYWGMWSGSSEGILNSDLTLNSTGLALKSFFATPPPPPPATLTPKQIIIQDIQAIIALLNDIVLQLAKI